MFLSTDAKVDFTRNEAKELGGAIYIANPRTTYMCDFLDQIVSSCSIQVLPDN
jgi:predicted outer membrane repeat protein